MPLCLASRFKAKSLNCLQMRVPKVNGRLTEGPEEVGWRSGPQEKPQRMVVTVSLIPEQFVLSILGLP